MKIDDGGPIQGGLTKVYLTTHNGQEVLREVISAGFTVRDGFAAAALIGLVGAKESIRALAMLSFAYADAMIAERNRETPE